MFSKKIKNEKQKHTEPPYRGRADFIKMGFGTHSDCHADRWIQSTPNETKPKGLHDRSGSDKVILTPTNFSIVICIGGDFFIN